MIPHAFFLDQDFSLKQLLSERRQESVRGSEVGFKSASLSQQVYDQSGLSDWSSR